MDVLNSVREMRSPVDSDVSVARAALDSEIADPHSTQARPRARAAMVAVGALVIGGIVAGNALGWSQPGSGGAEAAAAATLLNTAAVNVGEYDFPATDGQYIATTIVGSTLYYVHPGWEKKSFSDALNESYIADGAVAAVQADITQTVYQPVDKSAAVTTEQSGFEATAFFGDQDVAHAAASAELYGTAAAGVRTEPESATADTEPTSPVSPNGDYPTDAAAFRSAWAAANNSVEAPTDSMQMSTSMSMIAALIADDDGILSAPGEYRAVFLRALALGEDLTVVSTEGDVSVLEASSANDTFRITVDTAKGLIQKSEWLQRVFQPTPDAQPMNVGTASFVPKDAPREWTTVTQAVVDSKPADTSPAP